MISDCGYLKVLQWGKHNVMNHMILLQQMIPAVDPEALEDLSTIQEERKDEGKKEEYVIKLHRFHKNTSF